MHSRISIAAITLALCPLAADAATIIVSKTGVITTIQAGVDAANAGDIVLVKAGIYAEVVDVPANKPGLNLKAAGSVVLDARGPAGAPLGRALDVFADDVVVRGLTIRNAAQLGLVPGTGIFVTGDRVRIEKCSVQGCEAAGIEVVNVADVAIKDSSVRSCSDGIALVQTVRARVSKVTIESTEISAIALESDVDSTLEKVVVRNNRGASAIRTAAGTSDGLSIAKCKLLGTGDAAVLVEGANIRFANNVVRNSGGGVRIAGDGAVIEDNDLTAFLDASPGIALSQCTGGRIEGNTVRDASEAGIRIADTVSNTVVRGNVVQRAGSDDSAYVVFGSNIELEKCIAIEPAFGGFAIEGDQVTLTNCLVKDASRDGFHVDDTADATSFVACRALRCDAEGFDNDGTNTSLVDCVAQQNRLDVVNDGTFVLFDVTFATGGQNVPAELD